MVTADSDDGGFHDYVVQSVDPGNSMLIGTIVFSVLLLMLLPCLVSIGRRFQRHEPPVVETDHDSSQQDDSAVVATKKKKKKTKKTKAQKSMNQPYTSPYFNNAALNDDDDDDDEDDNNSVESKVSTVSSVATAVVNAILDSSPHGGPYRNPQQYTMKHRNDDDEEGSVMGSISHDAVSIRDAVDHDPNHLKVSEITDPQYSPWERLLTIAEWDYESKRLIKLGIPFIGQALLQGVVEAIRVAIIGRFVGTRALAAYVSVDLFVGLTTSILKGFQQALTAVCSQALGHGNRRLAGQYVQIATILFVICYIPVFLFWLVFIDNALAWLGFDAETVKIGADFTMLFLFAKFLEGVHDSAHSLLDVIGKEKYSTFFTLGQEIVSVGLLVAVALQPGTNDLQLIGIVSIAEEALGLVVNVIVIVCNGWFDRFLDGMVGSFALRNIKATKVLLGTSASLSLGELLAYGEWELLTIFASFLGPAEVAAWGLLGTLWDAVELVTEAVADAAEVRVAFLLGAGEPEKAKMSAYKSIFLGVFAAVLITSILFIGGEDIPTWLTTDPTLQRLTADLLPLFGLGNIALTIGTMSWTIVGAQGRYRLATGVGFGGSWLISIPLAAFLSMHLKFDLKGQTAAIVIGYMVSGTFNSYVLLQSDWPKLSRRVISIAAAAADDDDDSSSSSSDSSDDDDNEVSSNPKKTPVETPTTSTSSPTSIEREMVSTMESVSRSFHAMFSTNDTTKQSTDQR